LKKIITKKELVEWLKGQVLSSSPRTGKKKKKPGVVTHACNFSYSGSGGRMIKV
jgi:hypothetical protein